MLLVTLAPTADVRAPAPSAAAAAAEAGTPFRDCAYCPSMVALPAGSFFMGTPATDARSFGYERPVREVRIARRFAVGVYEVSFDEWDACVERGGCNGYRPPDNGWGRGRQPVVNVNWADAHAYARWLTAATGRRYRLLTEAEWEYAARTGSDTAYGWGEEIGEDRANCLDCGSDWDRVSPAPVGSFQANRWGIHDMHGNVWEWTQDCWRANYQQAPVDGGAWEEAACGVRVLRGGSWYSRPRSLRSATRFAYAADRRYFNTGFRVARTLGR